KTAACIDRGTVIDTTIGSGTKIDNQVQIRPNVQLGENCLLCGQVGIAGSAEIGDRCVLGGKAGLADHAKVGHDVVIAAYSGVSGSVSPRSVVMGLPAGPRATMVPAMLAMRRLPQLLRDVTALKKRFPEEGGGG
ncbi:MAG: UDP-3-O-(3-hydroxymyristoyl)glucosamine N-acyltransferase, partial [Pseudomonadota bacterium]